MMISNTVDLDFYELNSLISFLQKYITEENLVNCPCSDHALFTAYIKLEKCLNELQKKINVAD